MRRPLLHTWRERGLALLLAAAVAGAVVAVILATRGERASRISPTPPTPLPTQQSVRPNIVFVLTDDLSTNLVQYMPHVLQMERDGLTFEDYFVSDSLCCPSRASIFSGNFPHDTQVYGNTGTHGGFHVFHNRGEEQHTFAVTLQHAGYETAMMGKYLNGYLNNQGGPAKRSAASPVAPTYVPPGWNEWDVAGWGYPEFDYPLNEDGKLHYFGDQPSDYLTDVIARRGVRFIHHAAAAGKPFFLELATFAPHEPYVPAPRDADAFPGLQAPESPAFDQLPTDPPLWLAGHRPLTDPQIAQIDEAYRLRAQDVLSVDRTIGQIEAALVANGVAQNTYVVFSSDNGLHMGEYRLLPGKLTAFDTDIHVPLVVVGPDVPADTTTDAMTENIDLADTFSAIGRTSMPSDGHSLLPLLHGQQPSDWRNAILVEHHGGGMSPNDPDFQAPDEGDPPTYEAMRTHDYLYVVYGDGEREFYDLRDDPFELHNLASSLTLSQLEQLDQDLELLRDCHGGAACWAAMHVAPIAGLDATPLHREHRRPHRRHKRHRRLVDLTIRGPPPSAPGPPGPGAESSPALR